MQEGMLTVEARGDLEIVVTREFNAPRPLVWDAYTKPELLKRWLFGPDGWSMPHCEVDLRVGGAYRYEWLKDDGTRMAAGGVHTEIDAPSRMVITQVFDQDWTGGETTCSLDLAEVGGRTTLTSIIRYPSKEAREGALHSGMTRGMEAGYVRLEDMLTLAGAAR
jgi:uncharacterized protein YndB with AHSA1/START domain